MHNSNYRNLATGFTLIELMITVVIIAILASIALPSYQQYVIRGKRSAAKSAIMDIANREQQFLIANRRYADHDQLGYALPSDVAENYTLTITTPGGGVPNYTITLDPIAGGPQASDGWLSLDSQGVKLPVEKWQR